MSRFGSRELLAALVLLSAAVPLLAAADPEPDRSAWESGWHVVRPGDTLEGLATRFLGSSQLWRELHALNPAIRDPNLLYPGQRLRIFVERPTAKPSAMIRRVSRQVTELPRPVPWQAAGEGDVLLERDGLRTGSASSVRLEFDDGAHLTLSEDSLVFIRRQTAASAALPRKEIEIEVGQADVSSSATAARPGEIEIVVGGARARGRSESGSALRTRSRKGAANDAQFMVYDGSSTVSAAGQKVDVPAGSGTVVAAQAPPGPPERLLAAPTGLTPADGSELDLSAPRLSWDAVPEAASYTVEICHDAECGAIVQRATGVATAQHVPGGGLAGTLYWRVVAVAESALDGFPSPAVQFVAVDSVSPPAPRVVLRHPDGGPMAPTGCAVGVPVLQVQAVDRDGAELPWSLMVDGTAMPESAYRALPAAGTHEVVARSTDARGRSASSTPVRFTIDAAAPWIEILATGVTPAATAEPGEKERRRGRRRERKPAEPIEPASCDSGLEIADGSGSWRALPCSTAGAVAGVRLPLAEERSVVELRTSRSGLRLGGMRISAGEILRLPAWDVGCGLAAATLRIVPSDWQAGRLELEAVVEDRAGNRRQLRWRLRNSA